MKKRNSGSGNNMLNIETSVSPSVADRVSFAEMLSTGEKEFVELLTEGHSYEQIAKSININMNTVRDYVRSACKKLNVNSRIQAVVKCLRASLVSVRQTDLVMLASI